MGIQKWQTNIFVVMSAEKRYNIGVKKWMWFWHNVRVELIGPLLGSTALVLQVKSTVGRSR